MPHNVTPLFTESEAHHPSENGWLPGAAVIRQTGIAKSDLIRFIQLGVIPSTMFRVLPADANGVRKTYFSPSVLGHVAMLKILRDEGHTVQTIASELGPADPPAPPPAGECPAPPSRPTPPPLKNAPATPPSQAFQLPADTINTPAFFVDHEMHIAWVGDIAGDRLSAAIRSEMNDNPDGTVFDIMLRASLKELVFDWPPLFSFIYRFLEAISDSAAFEQLAPVIWHGSDDAAAAPVHRDGPRPAVDSCPIQLEYDGGATRKLRLYGIAVAEGALFVLEPEPQAEAHAEDKTAAAGAERDADRKTPFSVLSARIDDSQNIVDTLLPEAYFRLMTRIWDETDRIVLSYGGQRARRSGTDVQYILPRRSDTDPAFDAIRCAIELRDTMQAIEGSLKADGGWFADIRLNIGISSGRDHLRPEDLTASMAFMLPGGASDQAYHLCAIAHGGSILITKSAFAHLTLKQMARIVFGIYRDDRLVPNIFAKVSELPHAPGTPPLGQEIRALAVTRIIGLKRDTDDGENPPST
jgi:class 3 adenylate cyclase